MEKAILSHFDLKSSLPLHRVQAKMGGLMAALVPKARIVPAVRPEDMSQDPEVVKDYLSVSGSIVCLSDHFLALREPPSRSGGMRYRHSQGR